MYAMILLDPYVRLSGWLAEVLDWRFWHDWFHDVVLAGSYNALSRVVSIRIDLGVIDGFANGLASGAQALAASLRKMQTGLVRNYALSVFLGIVLILGYLVLSVFVS